MSKNAMAKNLRQSIWRSLGRYLAIVAIIALGASIFVGLLMTKTDMLATGQVYMDGQNMFDFRLLSSYGWDAENIRQIAALAGVEEAEGQAYQDVTVRRDHSDADAVYRFYALPSSIDRPVLRGGRMPEGPAECLIDGYHADDSVLGMVITLSDNNTEASLEAFRQKEFTVVGYASTPLYMDMNRGTTSVGNGSLTGYLFVLPEVFDLDYYTEVSITIPGSYDVYSQEYNTALEQAELALEPLLLPIAQQRYDAIRLEAEEAYAQGLAEYEEGLAEYEEGKAEAEKKLKDAENQLLSAQSLIYENEALIAASEKELQEGRQQLADGEKQLAQGKQTLQALKQAAHLPLEASRRMAANQLKAAQADLAEIDEQLAGPLAELEALNAQIAERSPLLVQLDSQISGLDSTISSLQREISMIQGALELAKLFPVANAGWIAELEARLADRSGQLAAAQEQRAALVAQREPLEQQLAEPLARRQALEAQLEPLRDSRDQAQSAVTSAQKALEDADKAIAAVDAGFADTEAEQLAGEQELEAARQQLADGEKQLAQGKAALAQGKAELARGWAEFRQGEQEARAELADAEAKLADARHQLDTARREIDDLKEAEVFLLDRRTNIGYNSLESSSDIVAGVSRVFPAFFLLVAALVCITTMTRMIDEERTQIGTLKALGYSSWAIINKYLVYAGSGAEVGCGLGVLLGSVVFPVILWEAYKIMLDIPLNITVCFNWWLIAAVVGTYTAVMLLVTWYCCRRTLQEQPAELIRPKAPDAGKKILMEYLPFWKRISFLNKVTIRNIFRYRQRLAMMLVGIGGCTALLLTGFGLRDSIVNVVDYQFEEVTPYDMTVYFSGDQSNANQAAFREDVRPYAQDVLFYHQSSIELEFGDRTREIYLISAGRGVERFINFHRGDEVLPLPGKNEAMLSVGAAQAMGIRLGDTILLRNANMQTLELTVSGIYDNHVYNYVIVSPDTVQAQWGQPPEVQMAFLNLKEEVDAHQVSAEVSGMYNVMSVSVSEDLADMVSSMMDALDLVVVVIVICAGALAVIVLYNLTNININERIREIATIKVLGFDAKETALYVFKENLSLTVVGSALGLGLGYLLLLFVMSQVKIDMVWFKALAMPVSYIWSIVLTILSALLVDLVFYFKLDKINMAEALKSVE